MGIYRQEFLPRIVDRTCGITEIAPMRARVVAGLSGDIVELGFGSGHNLEHLPPEVGRVLAVEPSSRARALSERRRASAGASVTFVAPDGQDLPLPDASVDAALSTFTLCTIPDPAQALGELRRVLRSGGHLHFLEHGRSPEPRVATWQRRLTPWQHRFFGGCHLDRPIADLLADSHFEILELRNHYMKGPRPSGYLYEGVAVPT